MPRTSAYDQNLDPNRPGEPLDGWDHIIVTDQRTAATWEFEGAYGESAPPVPSSIDAARNRLLIPPADKRG